MTKKKTPKELQRTSIIEDTGCHYAPKCLECHLPECVEMLPQKKKPNTKAQEVFADVTAGYKIPEIAKRNSISTNYVYQIMNRSQEFLNA